MITHPTSIVLVELPASLIGTSLVQVTYIKLQPQRYSNIILLDIYGLLNINCISCGNVQYIL